MTTPWKVLKFSRHYDTCDTSDISIPGATTRLIYASATSKPPGGSLSTTSAIPYHDRRGSVSVQLRSNVPSQDDVPPVPPDTPLYNMNFRVSNITISTSTSLGSGSGSSINVLGQDFMSTSADAEKTSYHCKTFSLAALDVDTFHAVQFNPIVSPDNKKKVRVCEERDIDAECVQHSSLLCVQLLLCGLAFASLVRPLLTS